MRVRRRIAPVLIGLVVMAASGAVTPTQASSAGAIAGTCDLLRIRVTGNELTTLNQGTCVITEYNGVGVATNVAKVARLEITSHDVTVICSGSAVRGFSGPVTFTVHGASSGPFHPTMVVDGAPGQQPSNPTATALVRGTSFAAAGTFTRNGSGNCGAESAVWELGHLTFEDPTL